MKIKSVLTSICVVFLVVLFSSSAPSVAAEPTIDLTVFKGDYLINICKKYLEDPNKWPEIGRINRLKNPNRIYPGQTLLVPASFLKGVPTEGVVTFAKGDVKIQPPGSSELIPLKLNDRIQEGSKVKTGEESAVEITLADGSLIFQRSNTDLGIPSIKQKGGVSFINKLSLQTGKVVSRIKGATGRESRLEIETPSSTGVARGTEFRTSVEGDGVTRFEVLEGAVSVAGKKSTIDIKEGEGTLIGKGDEPIEVRKLLPPPLPIDVLPLYRSLPLKFQFRETKEGASSLKVILAMDTDFRDVLRERVIKPRETAEIGDIKDGTYFLQVLSVDARGHEGPASGAVPVKVRLNPLPPFIRTPLEKGEYRGKSVEFSWLKVEDAAGYQIQIGEDGSFTRLAGTQDVKDLSYQFKAPDFKTYFFRVRSIAGDGYEGTWSDVVSFTMVAPPPSPQVETPRIQKDEMYLKWTDLGRGFTYRMQMAGDRDFSTMLVDKKSDKPETVIQKPTAQGTYYVRTSGIDASGYEGDFSPPQSFDIAAQPPYGVWGVLGIALLIILLGL